MKNRPSRIIAFLKTFRHLTGLSLRDAKQTLDTWQYPVEFEVTSQMRARYPNFLDELQELAAVRSADDVPLSYEIGYEIGMSHAERIAITLCKAYKALDWDTMVEQERASLVGAFRQLLDAGEIHATGPDDRDSLCWPCFRDRNEQDGRSPYDERDDAYVSSCNGCGHDHGD